jgi:signal transduction histidine kinase
MLRFGFVTRLALIFIFSLIVLQVFVVALFYADRGQATGEGFRLPLPDQIAAMVELIENGPEERQQLILRSVNTPRFSVRVAEAAADAAPGDWQESPMAARILRRYLAALGERQVTVLIESSGPSWLFPRTMAFILPASSAIYVELKTGETLVVESQGILTVSLFGQPPGFWASVFGFGIAVLTILLIRREARPLRMLARAADNIDLSGTSEPLPEAPRSAPEIRRVIAAYNRLQGRIAGLIAARMAIVGGISHDLRTYATRLRLRAEAIPDEAERVRAVRDIDDMIGLLDDAMLAISEGTSNHQEELVALDEIVSAEVEDRKSAGADVALSRSLNGAQPLVLGHSRGLRRLVSNVLDNATKYGGAARVELSARGRWLLVVVDDSGPGIPADKREAVLEPFVRLDPSRNRATGGAGLGLTIAKKVVETHNGRLVLTDAPDGGARVIIALPAFSASDA